MMPRFSFAGPRPDSAADELLATADRLEISLLRDCDGGVSIGVTLEAALGAEPCCGDESPDRDHDARRQASDRARGAFASQLLVRRKGRCGVKHKTKTKKVVATETRPRGRQPGVTGKVRNGIKRATELIASGMEWREVAAKLKITIAMMKDWQFRYPALWKTCYDAAMRDVVAMVQDVAGTNAVSDRVQEFYAAAQHAERWTRSRGERLFVHGDAMTLTRLFEEQYRPIRLREATQLTVDNWQITLRVWSLLTGDPPLSEITPLVLSRFCDCLHKMRGCRATVLASPTTVNTKLSSVCTLLSFAGPAGPHNRDALGIIDKVPWIRPPKRRLREVRIVTDDEVNAVYEATAAMDAPFVDGIRPPAWWKALLVTTYLTGLRRRTLFSLEMCDVQWSEARIMVPAKKMKTRRDLVVPLPRPALDHLMAIRTDRRMLFPWPYDVKSLSWFRTLWHRLQDVAGLERKRHFGLHDLRKTLATLIYEDNPAAAQLALGHTAIETTRTHYVQSAGIVARAVNRIPIPSAFRSSVDEPAEAATA